MELYSYSLSPWHGHGLKCFMKYVSASSDELFCLMTIYVSATLDIVNLECNSEHCIHVVALSLSISEFLSAHMWHFIYGCQSPIIS